MLDKYKIYQSLKTIKHGHLKIKQESKCRVYNLFSTIIFIITTILNSIK